MIDFASRVVQGPNDFFEGQKTFVNLSTLEAVHVVGKRSMQTHRERENEIGHRV